MARWRDQNNVAIGANSVGVGVPIGLLIYLLGVIWLLPVLRFQLPLNLAPIDFWNVAWLPFVLLFLRRAPARGRLRYWVPIWLILLGSLLGCFSSDKPLTSVVTTLKGLYLYGWFVLMTSLLVNLSPAQHRRLLRIWLVVAVVHGLCLLAQFLSPEILLLTTRVGKYAQGGSPRPLGWTQNPSMAGSFQLTAFVPMVFLRLGWRRELTLGTFLVLSILATGSNGCLAGLVVLLLVVVVTRASLARLAGLAAAAVLVCAVGFVAVHTFDLRPSSGGRNEIVGRATQLSVGRAEGGMGKRFQLWEEGLERSTPWGVGPGALRVRLTSGVDVNVGLHNDLLSFYGERGVLGACGLLALLGAIGLRLLSAWRATPVSADSAAIFGVFLGSLLAVGVQSQTHQVFHFRFLWSTLAFLECAVFWIGHTHSMRIARPACPISTVKLQTIS